MTLDEIRVKLCNGEFSSFSITWNDGNGSNHQTVKSMLEYSDDYYGDDDFLSPEDKQRCIDTNSIWTAHWYPDTPIGFYKMHASTFELLREYLENFKEDGRV